MRKIVAFNAGRVVNSEGSNREVKKFSVSTIRQRMKEDAKTEKVQFKNIIIDYRKVFNSLDKVEDVEEIKSSKSLFFKDVLMLLSDVINEKKDLNTTLGISSIIPAARKSLNKLRILVNRINKFYQKNQYLNKELQIEFTTLVRELTTHIMEAVFKGEVNEEELALDTASDTKEFSTKIFKFASQGGPKNKVQLFASAQSIHDILSQEDMDDSVDNLTETTIAFSGTINTDYLTKDMLVKSRVAMFSSDSFPISFVVPVTPGAKTNTDELLYSALIMLQNKGIIGQLDPKYNYDAKLLDPDELQFTVYLSRSKTQLVAAAANSVGIYLSTSVPADYKMFMISETPDNKWENIISLLSNNPTDSQISEVEELIMGDQYYIDRIRKTFGDGIADKF